MPHSRLRSSSSVRYSSSLVTRAQCSPGLASTAVRDLLERPVGVELEPSSARLMAPATSRPGTAAPVPESARGGGGRKSKKGQGSPRPRRFFFFVDGGHRAGLHSKNGGKWRRRCEISAATNRYTRLAPERAAGGCGKCAGANAGFLVREKKSMVLGYLGKDLCTGAPCARNE